MSYDDWWNVLTPFTGIAVDKEKNAAFAVVMGRLVLKGNAVPTAMLRKGVW
jgi:hypothetical protein